MTGTSTDIAATTPSWWRQSGPSGEADAKEDVVGGPAASAEQAGSGERFGFADFLDVINPLQHIPVVSTVYRELTGDQISPTARAMGGALYGGPVGLVAALAKTFSEAETGRDLGGNAVAMVNGTLAADGTNDAGATGVAQVPRSRETTDARPSTALPHQITLRHEDAPPPTAASSSTTSSAGTTGTEPIGASPYGTTPRWPIASTSAGAGSTRDAAASHPTAPTPTAPTPTTPTPTTPTPPTTTAETLAAATATRVPRQELPSMSERAFDRLMRNAGAQRASSVDNAGTAALSPANTTRVATTTTPEGRESVQDWMLRALEKYERMKTPTAATGGVGSNASVGASAG